MATQRLVRRVSRATAANAVATADAAKTEADIRKLDEETLALHLQSIAKLNTEIAARADVIKEREAAIEVIMKKYKMPFFSNGVLEATYEMAYSNEKKEIDPRKLFEHKTMKADKHAPFFECVKVQIGSLGQYLSEGEIKAISTITPPTKKGMALTIKAVKPVVASKPKRSA